MSLFSQGLTPRLRPLSTRKSATLSVLDVGTSKIVCLIAELQPVEASDRLKGRTHLARVIGIGHTRSSGLKGGSVVDLEAAERSFAGCDRDGRRDPRSPHRPLSDSGRRVVYWSGRFRCGHRGSSHRRGGGQPGD